MAVIIFTFGGKEIKDEKSAGDLANIIIKHESKIGSDIDNVILVTGKKWGEISEIKKRPGIVDEDPKEKADLIKKELITRGIDENNINIVQVNQIDFNECLLEIRSLCQSYQDEGKDVILNVTGGTKEMSFGAINSALMLGLRTFLLQFSGESTTIVELPILSIRFFTKMSDEMKEYLIILLIREELNRLKEMKKETPIVMLAEKIQEAKGISGSTFSGAKHKLMGDGLIIGDNCRVIYDVVKGKKIIRHRTIYNLTDLGRMYAELAKRELEGANEITYMKKKMTGKEKLLVMKEKIGEIKNTKE